MVGVESMTGTAVRCGSSPRPRPTQQYGVPRELRERVKAAFDGRVVPARPLPASARPAGPPREPRGRAGPEHAGPRPRHPGARAT